MKAEQQAERVARMDFIVSEIMDQLESPVFDKETVAYQRVKAAIRGNLGPETLASLAYMLRAVLAH